MAKYQVTFCICVNVDRPDINVGDPGDVTDMLTDDQWNDIVSEAVDIMEDVGNSVESIVRLDEDE